MRTISSLLSIFLLTLFSATVLHAQDASEKGLQISGYYKNLFVGSQSAATKEDFFADTNRLRLELKKQVDPWQFYLTLDNEAIINDFANTPDFDLIRSKNQNELAYWDLDKNSVDNDHLFLRHSIYRAYIKYYSDQFQAVLGKQAVDWGRTRFYSPLDLFNPTGPIDLEPEERVGVDAVNLNFSPQDWNINLVGVPGEDAGETRYGIKISKTVTPFDYALVAASINKDTVVGFQFDGSLADAGFRGEISHTETDSQKSFARASIGMDYNFTEKIYLLMEQFYNGGHEDNNAGAFTSSYKLARQFMSLKRNLTSSYLKYALTPLLDFAVTTIYDWDGKSAVVNPQVKYNMTSNADLAVGTQLFFGKNDSEFGVYENLVYVEFKWFF
jgi:hypothetical protein